MGTSIYLSIPPFQIGIKLQHVYHKYSEILVQFFLQFSKTLSWLIFTLKATAENPRGSVEKLSPKESVEGGDSALMGSVRAPKGFSKGKPEAAKPRTHSPRGKSRAKGALK